FKIISTKGSIELAAAEEILATAGGSYIKINKSGIEHGTPGTWFAWAATHGKPSEKSLSVAHLPKNYNVQHVLQDDEGKPYKNHKYIAWQENGQTIEGVTDSEGKTKVLYSATPEEYQVRLIFKDEGK
ncbi:DUF2345 domain-containing protein, partial [Hydromonas duriensis]